MKFLRWVLSHYARVIKYKYLFAITTLTLFSSLLNSTGVHSIVVALLTKKAEIQYDSELTDQRKLISEIKSLGFGATLISDSDGYEKGKINLTVSH